MVFERRNGVKINGSNDTNDAAIYGDQTKT